MLCFSHDSNSRNAAKELVAGAISGTIAAILTAPLDLAKTRMQVEYTPKSLHALAGKSMPRYTNLTGTLQRTLAEEGFSKILTVSQFQSGSLYKLSQVSEVGSKDLVQLFLALHPTGQFTSLHMGALSTCCRLQL